MLTCLKLTAWTFSTPLEPKLAPCGWCCPRRRPTLMGPFGNLVSSVDEAARGGTGVWVGVGLSVKEQFLPMQSMGIDPFAQSPITNATRTVGAALGSFGKSGS